MVIGVRANAKVEPISISPYWPTIITGWVHSQGKSDIEQPRWYNEQIEYTFVYYVTYERHRIVQYTISMSYYILHATNLALRIPFAIQNICESAIVTSVARWCRTCKLVYSTLKPLGLLRKADGGQCACRLWNQAGQTSNKIWTVKNPMLR